MRIKHEAMIKRTLAGYIRQHLAEIETRMEFGEPQTVIVEDLKEAGYGNLTVPAFRNYLARARARREQHQDTKHATTIIEYTAPKKIVPENTLSKPTGFEWPGTIDKDELI